MDEGVKVYTKQEAEELVKQLSKVFAVARILKTKEVAGIESITDENNKPICKCFDFWGKTKACDNCISYKVLNDHKERVKFEYLDGKPYEVISEYINVDGENCVLEILKDFNHLTIDPFDAQIFSGKLTNTNTALYHEPLTGCYNRAYYEDRKDVALLNCGVAFIDVDKFKSVNDLYGHLFGDEVLKGVAGIFLENIRETDAVVRYGGDEFLIIIPNIEQNAFEQKLNTILSEVNELEFYTNSDYHASISIGATIVKQKTLKEATGIADKLMFEAKKKQNTIAKDW